MLIKELIVEKINFVVSRRSMDGLGNPCHWQMTLLQFISTEMELKSISNLAYSKVLMNIYWLVKYANEDPSVVDHIISSVAQSNKFPFLLV